MADSERPPSQMNSERTNGDLIERGLLGPGESAQKNDLLHKNPIRKSHDGETYLQRIDRIKKIKIRAKNRLDQRSRSNQIAFKL